MDHPEAHERIADLVLEPGALAALATDPTPDAVDLRAHIDGCVVCRAEVADWRQAHAVIASAIEVDPGVDQLDRPRPIDDLPLRAPDSLRLAVAEIPRSAMAEGSRSRAATGAGARPDGAVARWRRRLSGVAVAAALLVAVGAGAYAFDQARLAEVDRGKATELADLTGWTSRVMSDPKHVSFALLGLDGTPAGVAAWSGDEYVITTTALIEPPSGTEYRCWLDRGGTRTQIGVMRFAGGTAYWRGRVDVERGFWRLGGRIGVSLETTGAQGIGAPVLIGRLWD